MKFHPITHFIILLDVILAAYSLPVPGSLMFLCVVYAVVFAIPSRTDSRLGRPFLKLVLFAALFLMLIHGIQWRPFLILPAGIIEAAHSFRLIALVIVSILYLSRQITGDEIYALLLNFRVPSFIILIIFRTLWLVPRFIERIDEVMLAQKLRGMPVDSFISRSRAVLPSLTPIFASMLEETFEQAMVITVRGFLEPGSKTHVSGLTFALRDWMVAVAASTAAVLFFLIQAGLL